MRRCGGVRRACTSSCARYRCSACGLVWRQDTTAAAAPRAKLTKTALRWALEALVVQKLTIARVADALDVSWHTANDAVLAEGRRVLISDPARLDGVAVLGVDEHVWRHTGPGDKKAEAEARRVQTRLGGLATAVAHVRSSPSSEHLNVKTAPRSISVMHAGGFRPPCSDSQERCRRTSNTFSK